MILTINRKRKTFDGIFGELSLDWHPFTCKTVENLTQAIPAGLYTLDFTYSPRFNRITPHIIVPDRDKVAGGDAGIRIHAANTPAQLQGCIAVGDTEEPDAVDNSRITLNKLERILYQQAGIQIQVNDIPS